MPQFVIEREMPGAGSLGPDDLKGASQASCSVLRDMGPQIQWVHSYVTDNKIYCIYRAPDAEMIRQHAESAGLSELDPGSALGDRPDHSGIGAPLSRGGPLTARGSARRARAPPCCARRGSVAGTLAAPQVPSGRLPVTTASSAATLPRSTSRSGKMAKTRLPAVAGTYRHPQSRAPQGP